MVAVPDPLEEPIPKALCLPWPVTSAVNIPVQLGIRGNGTSEVGELMDRFELRLINVDVGRVIFFTRCRLVKYFCLLKADKNEFV